MFNFFRKRRLSVKDPITNDESIQTVDHFYLACMQYVQVVKNHWLGSYDIRLNFCDQSRKVVVYFRFHEGEGEARWVVGSSRIRLSNPQDKAAWTRFHLTNIQKKRKESLR